jgi:HPt (histidine-containing phosphotransfer) domain-containing protein
LIGGRIVEFMATGRRPSRVAARVFRSLDDYAEATGSGEAYTDNTGFVVPELSSGRESFCPDASYFMGPFSDDPMRFLEGAPTFAVEVRSVGNYGPAAEAEMAAKRADYFEAGTAVVWDVDPVAEIVRKYTADAPDQLRTLREAASSGDGDAARRAAHTLKGNGRTFGATELASYCQDAEAAATAGDLEAVLARVDDIGAEWTRARTELVAFRDGDA